MNKTWMWMVGAAGAVLIAAVGVENSAMFGRAHATPIITGLDGIVVDVPFTVPGQQTQTLRMRLDTGAALTQIKRSAIDRWRDANSDVTVKMDKQVERLYRFPTMQVAGAAIDDFTVASCSPCGGALDGVLGRNALEALGVEIDMARNRVTFSARPVGAQQSPEPWLQVKMRRKPRPDGTPGIRLAVRNRSDQTVSSVTVVSDCAPEKPVRFKNLAPGERQISMFAVPDGARCLYRSVDVVEARW
ncbi:MAG: hypothetical protein AAFV53_20770 [Myxococcota bacterium]